MTAAPKNTYLTDSGKLSLAALVLTSGIALGVLGDVLLRAEPGFAFALWISTLAALGAALIARRDGRLTTEQSLWLALAVILAWTLAVRNDDGLRVFTVLGIVAALIGARTVAAGSPVASVLGARVLDVIRSAAAAVFDVVAGFPRLVLVDTNARGRTPSSRAARLLAGARPVFIAVPILFVFAVLLVQADPVFGSWFRLPWDFETVVEHAFLVLFLTWIVAGGFRGAVLGGSNVAITSLPPIRLGTSEVATVLGGLALLFLAFIATQIGSLFGGEALVQRTTGLTYAEYARRGFFELLVVSALLLPTLLVGRATLEDERSVRLFRRLSAVLLVLLLAILVSAVARLQLYVRYYGLTDDRLYAVAVLVWLALVWAWFAATMLREQSRLFVFGAIVAAYGVLAVLHVLGPDRVVTRFNLANPRFGAVTRTPVDYAYLATLDGDGVPSLVNALVRPPLSAPSSRQWTGEVTSRCQAVTSLLRKWGPDAARNANDDWRSWNLAVVRARRAVREHEPELRQTSCIENGELVPFTEFSRRQRISSPRREPTPQQPGATPPQR